MAATAFFFSGSEFRDQCDVEHESISTVQWTKVTLLTRALEKFSSDRECARHPLLVFNFLANSTLRVAEGMYLYLYIFYLQGIHKLYIQLHIFVRKL